MRRKRAGIKAVLIQLGFRLLHSGHRKRKWTKWDSSWQNKVTPETVVPTETFLHLNISDFALDRWTVFWADRAQDYSLMRRGAWYSHTVEVDGQCFPDVELLISICRPHNHHYLAAAYIKSDADIKYVLQVIIYLYTHNCIYLCLCVAFHFIT